MTISQGELTLGKMLRGLRVARGLKQREMAEMAGVTPGSWGNAESVPYRVIGRERLVKALARIGTSEMDTMRVLAAYDAAPSTPFQERRKAKWKVTADGRRAVKQNGPIRIALARLLDELGMQGRPCACYGQPGAQPILDPGYQCALCAGMRALGLPGWIDPALVPEAIDGVLSIDEFELSKYPNGSTPLEDDVDFG